MMTILPVNGLTHNIQKKRAHNHPRGCKSSMKVEKLVLTQIWHVSFSIANRTECIAKFVCLLTNDRQSLHLCPFISVSGYSQTTFIKRGKRTKLFWRCLLFASSSSFLQDKLTLNIFLRFDWFYKFSSLWRCGGVFEWLFVN